MTELLTDKEFLFLDLQSSTANPRRAHPIEAAWCIASARQNSTDLKIHSTLIQLPRGVPYSSQSARLTGIRKSELRKGVDQKTFLEQVLPLLSQYDLMVHFARFEKSLIDKILKKFSKSCPYLFWICTHQLSKCLMPGLPAYGLRAVSGYLGAIPFALKRAPHHIEATHLIWRHLALHLSDQGILQTEQLKEFLKSRPKFHNTGRDHSKLLMEKEKRLNLEDRPGVYRFIHASGQVLYVGKATSLKSRVNSYFRGKQSKGQRLHELMMQASDIVPTACASALEAALLEADEIKRLKPLHNIALRSEHREIFYCDDNFQIFSPSPHPARSSHGPFTDPTAIVMLQYVLTRPPDREWMEDIIHESVSMRIFKAGIASWLKSHNFKRQKDPQRRQRQFRRALALGLRLVREKERLPEVEEPSEKIDPIDKIFNVEDIRLALDALARRAARQWHRASIFNLLFHADVYLTERKTSFTNKVKVRLGCIDAIERIDRCSLRGIVPLPTPIAPQERRSFDIGTLDRLQIIRTELRRLKTSFAPESMLDS